jgi:hypothetical protein
VIGTLISGSPVPAGGGTLMYEVFLENLDPVPLSLDVWHDVVYQGTDTLTVVRRFIEQFLPGWTIYRPDLTLPISSNWPGGIYESIICAGMYPEQIWGEDSFSWEKEGAIDFDFNFAAHIPAADFLDQFDIITTDSVIPDRFDVIDVYPNPFNQSTTISFALPEDAKVMLSVYNLQGQAVATLLDGLRNAGTHVITFDALDLASGIYLYRLTTGSQTVGGKMLLLK